MKLLELEIHDIRGIRDLTLNPNGKNFVVWGANGSGKSAVVDALDFLLTGRIARLTGKGTGSITLDKHGPHIDSAPEAATVRAVVQLADIDGPVEITRCLARPNELNCDDATRLYLEKISILARRGQHALTRREILKYITAEGSTRAQEIQALLNIEEIESVRATLVKVRNAQKNRHRTTNRSLITAQGAVSATIQETEFQPETVLKVINENRAILGASPITDLSSKELKSNIQLPTIGSTDQSINVSLIETDISNLLSVISNESRTEISSHDKQLRKAISHFHSNPNLLRAYKQQSLVSKGIGLIDESGDCPLCDTPWEDGKLEEYLKQKLSSARVASDYQEVIKTSTTVLNKRVSTILASLKKVIPATKLIGLEEEVDLFSSWRDELLQFSEVLDDVIEAYLAPDFQSDSVELLFAPNSLTEITGLVVSKMKARFPKSTPEQTAWDTLTRLEENLTAIEKANAQYQATKNSLKRASVLLESFQQARDNILKKVYDSIKDRFVNLYKGLHGVDEDEFDAVIEPDGAALNLEVGFYGRGVHPPHALHSEGHQDSMGLCLYLALAEKLTEGLIDIIILDDVVMSVDADHRRQLCHLLVTEFPNRQFLITTHDKTWATQLRTQGVVTSKSLLEFFNWNIETGPQVNDEVVIWEKIDQDIQNNDIPVAAARLRRGSEQFFGLACDSLQVPVTYKINGRYELGNFLSPSINQLRYYLKKAKVAANSWNDQDTVTKLSEFDSTINQIHKRTKAEQWAVNASVHYSNWANLSAQDFSPVVEAFQDLFSLFLCSNCGGMLYVVNVGPTVDSIKCKCGKVNWNLKTKS